MLCIYQIILTADKMAAVQMWKSFKTRITLDFYLILTLFFLTDFIEQDKLHCSFFGENWKWKKSK